MEMNSNSDGAWVFAFEGDRMWVEPSDSGWHVWSCEGAPAVEVCEPMGMWMGRPAWAIDVPAGARPDGLDAIGLRGLFDGADEGVYAEASRAYQLVNWRRTHRFCGVCGGGMVRSDVEGAMICAACRHTCFPRINPVVITRITRGEQILLARRATPQFRFYSVIAGFVEAGETLEHAVAREIMEEVGLSVTNIRYFGSQPWSFPNNLMVGFTAEYAGGEIHVDGVEIGEADWFTRDRLPDIPGSISISRRLIDDFVSAGSSSG